MKVYRIERSSHGGDMTGEGAKLNGGRWNHQGFPMVYTSESRALAVLEYAVNVNINNIPRALNLVTIEISETIIEKCSVIELPGNWKSKPAPASAKDWGTAWLSKKTYPYLKIPSSVIEEEFNYLLNPLHPKFNVRLLSIQDFIFDVRIKSK